jgi:CheY-like chemotaxis protein
MIELESKEGEGSTFTLRLPLQAGQKTEKTQKPPIMKKKTGDRRKLTILIAEDEEASAAYLDLVTREFSKQTYFTKTGRETVELFLKHPEIDLILMDFKMPDMNGYEATHQIRRLNQKVKIVGQTAYGLAGDDTKALQAGCDDYISKPINKEKLRMIITNLFK